MTRDEYKAKLKGLRPQMDCDLEWKYTQEYITSLEARIAELDNELSALRTKWDELPAFLVKQDEADIFDEHNLNMLLIEYLLDIKPEE